MKYKIEIDVTIDETNNIGVNMKADNDITAFDFIRVVNSLSHSIQDLVEEYCDEADEIESMEDAEKIKLNDLGRFNELVGKK